MTGGDQEVGGVLGSPGHRMGDAPVLSHCLSGDTEKPPLWFTAEAVHQALSEAQGKVRTRAEEKRSHKHSTGDGLKDWGN